MQTQTPYPQAQLSANDIGLLRERAALTEDSLLAKALQRITYLEWIISQEDAS